MGWVGSKARNSRIPVAYSNIGVGVGVINKFVFYNYQEAFHVHIPLLHTTRLYYWQLAALVCVNNKIEIEIS